MKDFFRVYWCFRAWNASTFEYLLNLSVDFSETLFMSLLAQLDHF